MIEIKFPLITSFKVPNLKSELNMRLSKSQIFVLKIEKNPQKLFPFSGEKKTIVFNVIETDCIEKNSNYCKN